MKFRKIILSLLTAALMGTAAMPAYAADISAGEYSGREYSEDCAAEDEVAVEEYMEEGDEVAVEEYMQEEDEVAVEQMGYVADKSEQEMSGETRNAMQDNSMALILKETKSMKLVSSKVYDIDNEVAAEVNDYESRSVSKKAAPIVSTVEHSRTFRIYRKKDNATYVQWVLRGVFEYNGKTSRCKDTSMRCYNNAPGTYQVTSRTSYKSGMYAVGNCRAVNKKTGKAYAKMLRFGVTAAGKVVNR